jgi:hypothetical protein
VDVQDSALVVLHQPRTQYAHEAGQDQQLWLPVVELGGNCLVECLTRLEVAVFDAQCVDSGHSCASQAVSVGPV